MSYIAPNSKIYIYNNVPLDIDYVHTIYFNSLSSQTAYFSGASYIKHVLENYSYIRSGGNKCKVQIPSDDLYDCGYMRFQNTSFGSKWFYAFITNVEYVNNTTSEITFEIDELQTWFFEMELKECFVEREHSVTDVIGENLLDDNLETGDYIFSSFESSGKLGSKSIVVACTFDADYEDNVGGYYTGIYTGLYYNIFNTADEVNTFIEGAVLENKIEGIVSMFMMPTSFTTVKNAQPNTYDINITKNLVDIDGYTPSNNKLFTYPYNFLYVTNLSGNSANLPYEYFDNETDCQFLLAGDMSCNPSILLIPKNYKGVVANYNEKMVLDGYPQCAYNSDVFKVWLAQTGASSVYSGVTETFGTTGVGGFVSGSILGAMSGVVGGLMVGNVAVNSILGKNVNHFTMPPQSNNSQGSSSMLALGVKDFAFMKCSIRNEFAVIIDNYFSMYGYPCRKVKVPNISSRPFYNYVKTSDCNITGDLPSNSVKKIAKILDNGITFWKPTAIIGDYSVNNKPT